MAIPQADVTNMRALSGDPEVTSRVVGSSPRDIGRFCAVQLMSLSPADRREALRIASSLASGPEIDIVPLPGLMPADASVEELAQLWNGLALMILSLGTASADTSVGTVVANASSMASGAPFASDPAVVERQNEILLAKAILEAALLGEDEAKRWFEDNHMSDALKRVSDAAKVGKTDMVPYVTDAMQRLADSYDCAKHNEPFGGDAGSSNLASFWNQLWGNAKDAMGAEIKAAASNTSQAAAEVANDEASRAMLADSISNAMAAVAEAKRAMEDGNANLAEYRERLRSAALQQAKLQWAAEILSAPDEVATILSAANPNMSDAGTFLQSMLSTLPAAKTTGNLGTIKALIYALKAASARGDGSADSLYSLLSGSPDALVESLEQLIMDANTATLEALLNRQSSSIANARQNADTGNISDVLNQAAKRIASDAKGVGAAVVNQVKDGIPKSLTGKSLDESARPNKTLPAAARFAATVANSTGSKPTKAARIRKEGL